MKTLVVVDAQNDFISGSLACQGSESALENIVKLIENDRDMAVVYTADWHSKSNESFKENGGIWPVHCVENTEGAALYKGFYELTRKDARPNENSVFKKGKRDDVEEYSGCRAMNEKGDVLEETVKGDILVAGFASEYCVRETLLGLAEKGHSVALYLPGVAYVDRKDHEKNIKNLEAKGFRLIKE